MNNESARNKLVQGLERLKSFVGDLGKGEKVDSVKDRLAPVRSWSTIERLLLDLILDLRRGRYGMSDNVNFDSLERALKEILDEHYLAK